nr:MULTISPECIES: hypothetical protein [Arthrobacter]
MSPTAPAATITPTLRRRRGLTEQAAVAAVDQACRRLRLPTVRAVLDEALTVAGKEQLSYQGSWPSCCWLRGRSADRFRRGPSAAKPANNAHNA